MTAASVKNVVSILCGVALLYMVLGSLVSLAFPNAAVFRSSCTPGSVLQTLTQCDGAILNRMWRWTVGIPRFLLAWPILALLLIQTFGANFGSHASTAAVVQTLAVIGLAALAATTWIGLRFWQKRSTVVMLLLLLVFFGFSAMYLAILSVSAPPQQGVLNQEFLPENP
jgi:hypothetical protein